MPNRHPTVSRRTTMAALDRTLRVAAKHGRVAVGVKHHPSGVVEFMFSDTTTAPTGAINPWDE